MGCDKEDEKDEEKYEVKEVEKIKDPLDTNPPPEQQAKQEEKISKVKEDSIEKVS